MKNIYCSIIQPLQGCISCLHTKPRIACGAINIFPLRGKSRTVNEFATNNANPFESYLQYFLLKFRRDVITFTKGSPSSFQQSTKIDFFETKLLKLGYRTVKFKRDLITLTTKGPSSYLKKAEVFTFKFKTLKLYYRIAKSQRNLITLIKGAVCNFIQKTKIKSFEINPFKLNIRIAKSRRDLITIAIGATYGINKI